MYISTVSWGNQITWLSNLSGNKAMVSIQVPLISDTKPMVKFVYPLDQNNWLFFTFFGRGILLTRSELMRSVGMPYNPLKYIFS